MDLRPSVCYRAVQARDARFDGRFFTCVKTTGIYCRPICPARPPNLENCTFVPTAAAAQAAGFRPCLRCRPESSPDLDAWRGTSATVSRALKMIEQGALDNGDVAALANRLEIGDRQLRRLFQQHVGATPVSVAQTRRILLAKQLIHQTDLSMIEVALASGFGSVRRFNETFQQLYRRPPSQLRRRTVTTSPAPEISLLLPYRRPYDWAAMLSFLQLRGIAGLEIVVGDTYSRVIAFAGATGSIQIVHAPQHSALRVIVRFPRLDALPTIIARIRRMFDLSAEPVAIESALSFDPLLAPLIAARPGLRVPGAWDPFEIAVRAVLGQQITVKGATALAGRIVLAIGTPVESSIEIRGLTHAFPLPEDFSLKALTGLGLTKARAMTLAGIAAAAVADARLFDPRRDLSEAVARLRELPGVGEWTAQYIAMRALGESDAFLAGDVAIQRRFNLDGSRPAVSELLTYAERWRPWRAYAMLHLWMADTDAVQIYCQRKTAMHLRLERWTSPLSPLLIVTDDDGLLRALDFPDLESRMSRLLTEHYGTYTLEDGAAPLSMTRALHSYFNGEVDAIDEIITATGGTPFQREVWKALRAIPAGTTTSYGQLAVKLGRGGSARAVGAANGANPIPIVVPCHRVIGANGSLTGFASGLPRKRWLLDHESLFSKTMSAGDSRYLF